ncbi:SUMO-specific isopeptidase USPL1 [Hyla sarda]|uniref:SUMO-specific isopeptidase USPL1 n=1 Tax=Hyla sarda TaxID=327740 RepID=UPI0024C43E4D|nr:SUMO-specific isopeptidase USPL1 [Hyla sarda]XP_056417832.1 SUMO-specific isopeptidase USPL1 [Hyla sarda]
MTKMSQWVTTMASKTPGSTVSLVGQGPFLDKPSLHMVGYMGENPNGIHTSNDGWCPVCKIKGQTQALKTYRINFTQSIFLCTNPQCIYPLGYTPLDNIIANTADLKKNSGPNKQKKRCISTLSPSSVPCEKRPKIDLPISGASQTVQTGLCEELPGLPTLECDTNSPKRLKDGLTESTISQTQNVSGSTNTSSSFTLQDKPSFPILPMEPPIRYAPSASDGLPIIKDNNQEVLQNGDLEEIDTLCNDSPLPLPPESDLMANKVDKEQEVVKQSSETENETHMIDDQSRMQDNTPSHVSPPTPVLQNLQQPCQVEENSSKEISIVLSNIEKLPDSASGLPQLCESVKDNLSLLETPKEQMENLDGLTDQVDVEAPSCNKASLLIQCNDLEVSENTVSSELQNEEFVQQMKDSLQNIPPPPCPEAAVQENDFGSADLSKTLQMMQESCEMLDASQAAEVVLEESPAEGHASTGLWKPVSSPPCCVVEDSEKSQSSMSLCDQQTESLAKDNSDTPVDFTSLMPDMSVVSTEDPSLPVPNLSLPQKLEEDCKKTNSEEHNPSNIIQDLLPEIQGEEKALENTCDSPATSVPSVKDQAYADAAAISLLAHQLSKILDLTQTCQKNDMATPVSSSLDSQPVCHPDDRSFEKESDSCETSASVMIDDCSPCKDANSLHKMPLPSPQILLEDSLECHRGMKTPSGSLQNTQTLNKNSEVGSSLCGIRVATDCEKALAHRDAKSPDKMPLPKPQIVLQDCFKCHCGINKSLQNTNELDKNSDGSLCRVRDATDCETVSPNKDAKPLKIMPGAKILLKDCLKCHCGMNTPSKSLLNAQELDNTSALEVGSSLCGVNDTTDAEMSAQSDSHKDSNIVATGKNPTDITTIESESPISKKKKFYENTILPDLLLDIQPEHRMDESISAAPSPACDATVSMTLPSDTTKQDVSQKGQVLECDSIMEATDDDNEDNSRMSDAIEASYNSEELADDGNDSMEAKTDDPAQVVKTPELMKVKTTERRLQWKNKHSLCWLDCILSALVQSKTLNDFVAGGHMSKESVIHNLFTKYDEATALFLKSIEKRKKTEKRPKYDKCLNDVRMGIFEKLKPLLQCKLGKNESPVFAFPSLLNQDPQTEKLFGHTFMWKFKCEVCGYSYQQRCQKTLTTFTNPLPEWRPLNAVHVGPCNQCKNTEQKRSMVLERLNSVFMVHFVEGLPSSDLEDYSFQFQGHSYEVKAIIKYRNEHFSTWISNDDGTWLESDDLRGSFCRRHQKFRVRAADIHIVIWERTDGNTFEENVHLGAVEQEPEFNSANISMVSEDECFSSVGAVELSPQVPSTVPPVALNASNPLAGMEGYADDDVITLTLVEIPLETNGQPVVVPTKLQATDTSQGEGTHASQTAISTVMSSGIPKRQEDCTLTSPISSNSSVKAAPLKNSSGVRRPPNPAGNAIATSTPIQQRQKNSWSGVGNWMTRLIKKDQSILNLNLASKKTLPLVTCPPLKVTDPNGAPRKAQSFNGFQGRSTSNTSISTSNLSPTNTEHKPSFSTPKEKGTPIATPSPAPTASCFRIPGSSTSEYSKRLLKDGNSSNGDKIGKLRLKLLKKLKAKKNELATLEKLSKMQGSGAQVNGVPQGGFNRKEHLQGFLDELQEHIDNADNESVCTMSSSTSICSSPGDAEFFAELFSPSPANNQPDDSRYMEMLVEGCGIAPANQLGQANDQQPIGNFSQATSGSSNAGPTPRDESLNLMSNSTLAVLNEDNGYFDLDYYF